MVKYSSRTSTVRVGYSEGFKQLTAGKGNPLEFGVKIKKEKEGG